MPRKPAAGPLLHAFVLLATSAVAVVAAEPSEAPKPGDALIGRFLASEADRLAKRELDGAASRAEWDARTPRRRRELLDMLGLWPLPERTPLHAQVTGTIERDGDIVIEKLHFQSRPGLYVTGNLYRPRATQGKHPAVLYVCGHSGRGRDGNKTAFQHHGLWFARNGYVCLIVDTLQLGEVAGKHHGTYNLGRWWWHSAGYTPAGVECWNGVRAIDYLSDRPDVDPDKIGVTGISGGGAATFWIAAADERVHCAAAVSGMSDLDCYVTAKVVNGHCDCMFLYNFDQFEWTSIAALVAPRPLLFANSDEDRIFPMDGNRRIFARLQRLYGMYDRPELVGEYVSHGGHEDRPDLRVAAFEWFNRHLKNDKGPVSGGDDPPLEGKRLRVFPEDADLPADARNAAIDETFVPRARVELPARAEDFAAWKQERVRQLRGRPFRALPERVPAADPLGSADPSTRVQRLSTEPGIEVAVRDLRGEKGGPGTGTLVVLNPGEDLHALPGWAGSIVSAGDAVLLAPRGVGPTGWTRGAPPNYVERAHALLGRTVDEGRVRDVAATARWLAGESDGRPRWRVAGARQAGVVAAYAALFEPSLAEVVVVDPPASHRDGPYFLGVLRVLDVPEALGLLAPTRLTMLDAPESFHQTGKIYERAGAGAAFSNATKPVREPR